MMTTTDLTVVEQFNVDDRQTSRTQSADTLPYPWTAVDIAWPKTLQFRTSMPLISTTSNQTAISRANASCSTNTANVRPPTLNNQSRVPLKFWTQLNMGHNSLATLVDSLRLKFNYLHCRTTTRPLKSSCLLKSAVRKNPRCWLADTPWRHLPWRPQNQWLPQWQKLYRRCSTVPASFEISSDVQFCSLVYFFCFNNKNPRWMKIICKF